jgi:hypothetical protein
VADKLPEKVADHIASDFSKEVHGVLAGLTDEELKVLANVRRDLTAANAPDHLKAQIV